MAFFLAKKTDAHMIFFAESNSKAKTTEKISLIGINHQYQQLRCKSKIKFCGYIEPPAFKKRDLRYKTSTVHDPKRMSWHDYQVGLLLY
ncbi:hypothetical protein QR98_0073810 [Sarcoptes scabiei]|uniref:Uncharacterized protein n=1 Tax=Sarcoptes scabiei TaxID=52283 RepID=A0A132ACY9_SARSC|nr:hypothetical protein QR98_0073810 [Sarcoptes scabiei]